MGPILGPLIFGNSLIVLVLGILIVTDIVLVIVVVLGIVVVLVPAIVAMYSYRQS